MDGTWGTMYKVHVKVKALKPFSDLIVLKQQFTCNFCLLDCIIYIIFVFSLKGYPEHAGVWRMRHIFLCCGKLQCACTCTVCYKLYLPSKLVLILEQESYSVWRLPHLPPFLPSIHVCIKEFTLVQRQLQEEHQRNRFTKQNIKSAASHFFVHFFIISNYKTSVVNSWWQIFLLLLNLEGVLWI